MTSSRQELLAHFVRAPIPFQYTISHPPVPDPAPDPAPTPADVPETRPEPIRPISPPPQRPQPRRPGHIPLPRHLTLFLRTTAGLDLVGGTWLLLVAADRVPCATRLCEVATLNGKHEVAGLIAVIAAILLAAAALFTSGLTRADSVVATVLVGIALTGLLAVAGVVLAAALVLSAVGLVLGVVVAVMVGAIRGDLTR